MFITASFRNGENQKELDTLCDIVRNSGFVDYCFARDKEITFDDPQEMMRSATEEIENVMFCFSTRQCHQ